jgi:hypothetical protein
MHCICCSKGVQDRFREEGDVFIKKAIMDSNILEATSGLEGMKTGFSSFGEKDGLAAGGSGGGKEGVDAFVLDDSEDEEFEAL